MLASKLSSNNLLDLFSIFDLNIFKILPKCLKLIFFIQINSIVNELCQVSIQIHSLKLFILVIIVYFFDNIVMILVIRTLFSLLLNKLCRVFLPLLVFSTFLSHYSSEISEFFEASKIVFLEFSQLLRIRFIILINFICYIYLILFLNNYFLRCLFDYFLHIFIDFMMTYLLFTNHNTFFLKFHFLLLVLLVHLQKFYIIFLLIFNLLLSIRILLCLLAALFILIFRLLFNSFTLLKM